MSTNSRPTFDLNIPSSILGSPSMGHNIGECSARAEGLSTHPNSGAVLPDYETMYSGSSENTSGEPEAPPIEDVEVTMRADQIIQQHTVQNVQNLDDMMVSNEFQAKLCTAQEWDASDDIDVPVNNHQENFDADIPDHLYEGMTFGSKETLQCALAGWSIIKNVEYKKSTSNKTRLTVVCVQHDNQTRPCLWRLHAAKSKRLGGVWKISTITGRHTCTNPILSASHRNCTSKFICQFITGTLRQQLDLKPKEIITRISSKFDVQVSYMKAWDARRKAIRTVFGSYEESYSSLYRMMEAIRLAVPGSVYNIQVTQGMRFKSIFWSFGPSILGWQHCRPILCLDGTFLLGKYRGTLLAAVGVDGNGGLYPLAFAVVESESIESWIWFLQMLHDLILSTYSRPDLCIISDKHAGLIRGCSEVFPWAAHRHCLRHLRENFKKVLRRLAITECDAVCDKMYWAGNTDDIKIHERHMKDIQNIKKEAYDWLMERDRTKWALTYDGGFRYGVMTTNASECFNGVLRRARGLPIQGLIMSIYYNLVSLFIKRAAKVEQWIASDSSAFVPRTKAVLELAERQARRSPQPTQINNHEFEVFGMSYDMEGRGERGRARQSRRGTRAQVDVQEVEELPSIRLLGDAHRASRINEAVHLVGSTHLHMAREWPIRCRRMLHALQITGLDSIRHQQFIQLDHALIGALVERWCPLTNTFHLPVGEMTITLQDVQLILGIRIDGAPIIGSSVVGDGLRWDTWIECCNELLGSHADPNVTYHDPDDNDVEVIFRMGHSQAYSIIPLRWLRWTFYRESYEDLPRHVFLQHVRAYIMYMLGCYLLPDTSGSHVHMQYLPLLEHIENFAHYSLGSAVLAHLYRELNLATRPSRMYIAGCLPLLQVWAWERIHVGRPTLRVPYPRDIIGKPLALRWAEGRVREVPLGNMMTYRDELDGLQLSQWHLPDRVMRQFGGIQPRTIEPMEREFRRVDGRGRAEVDWLHYHRGYIELWNNRLALITTITHPLGDGQKELSDYLQWYRSWASIYLLKAATNPPETIYPRSPGERIVVDYFLRSKEIAESYATGQMESGGSINQGYADIVELARQVEQSVYIDTTGRQPRRGGRTSVMEQPARKSTSHSSGLRSNPVDPPRHSMYVGSADSGRPLGMTGAGPSIIRGEGSSSQGRGGSHWTIPESQWPGTTSSYGPNAPYNLNNPIWTTLFGWPGTPSQHGIVIEEVQPDINSTEEEVHQDEEEEPQLQRRSRRVPSRYTPGTDALKPRKKR
ncbi:hypothetical protein KFK09_023403 [Dendrobium nobile]|uniref:Serine/threonine-protein phosphatase 7 long form-like n=1 Tax=Dendrobium nobile TaxID=94219 RepID=A0A8T3ASK1_DENNO|nr:hypothetical protein KFK09_023403 [Dendrobium nobile]